jgi:hypothetical protein
MGIGRDASQARILLPSHPGISLTKATTIPRRYSVMKSNFARPTTRIRGRLRFFPSRARANRRIKSIRHDVSVMLPS